MKRVLAASSPAVALVAALLCPSTVQAQAALQPEVLVSRAEAGRFGGQLVVAQRAEPRTLNPVIAVDGPSKDVARLTMGDLVHINRSTQQTEPALAKSWTVSPDGRRYTLALRQGIRFSDGDPFDADDVVFSFQVYLDPKVASPNRDFLIIEGQPIAVRKLDAHKIEVALAKPYAAAERIFDSIAILPRHLLEQPYKEGRFGEVWGLAAKAAAIAGLGPFRFSEHVPGQRLVLERNPHYWKVNRDMKPLPYLDRLIFVFVPNEDAQAVRLQSGEADVVSRISAANYDVLSKTANAEYELFDAGTSLEYAFVFFNLNDVDAKVLTAVAR